MFLNSWNCPGVEKLCFQIQRGVYRVTVGALTVVEQSVFRGRVNLDKVAGLAGSGVVVFYLRIGQVTKGSTNILFFFFIEALKIK